MAEETNNAPAAKGGIGHIVRVVGPVVDVEFAPSEMPAIYNALRIDADKMCIRDSSCRLRAMASTSKVLRST